MRVRKKIWVSLIICTCGVFPYVQAQTGSAHDRLRRDCSASGISTGEDIGVSESAFGPLSGTDRERYDGTAPCGSAEEPQGVLPGNAGGGAEPVSETADAGPDRGETASRKPLHRLAVKTNLLYDAILMPSLEVEYRINDRWSVAVEGDVAWWKRDSAHKYYQISTILAEGRYWFHTREPWHGHYVGVFAGGSWYDLENGERGYKGEFWTAGISYGYMFPIGRSWSFEAGLGVGFLRTRYEEYLPLDGHYVYQQTSRTNWLGPVKVKFALVYRLWDINRKGGRK